MAGSLVSCSVFKPNVQSQCESEFVRQSISDKTKDMLSAKFKPEKVEIEMGKSTTLESVDGEHKCQMDMTIKAVKMNYKSRSVAEIGGE